MKQDQQPAQRVRKQRSPHPLGRGREFITPPCANPKRGIGLDHAEVVDVFPMIEAFRDAFAVFDPVLVPPRFFGLQVEHVTESAGPKQPPDNGLQEEPGERVCCVMENEEGANDGLREDDEGKQVGGSERVKVADQEQVPTEVRAELFPFRAGIRGP